MVPCGTNNWNKIDDIALIVHQSQIKIIAMAELKGNDKNHIINP